MARRSILRRQIIGMLLAMAIVASSLTPQAKSFLAFPTAMQVAEGEILPIPLTPGLMERLVFKVKPANNGILTQNGSAPDSSFRPSQGNLIASKPGTIDLELRLFGIIPLKRLTVTVAKPALVIPGGQSIGIFVKDGGITVKQYSSIISGSGRSECPARTAGVRPGDLILRADGQSVNEEWVLAEIIDQAGREKRKVKLVIERNGKNLELEVLPIFCSQNQRYRIGLLVRDNTAGVGTLTFYDPQTQLYGALGHVILDPADNRKEELRNGKIVSAWIQGIEPGRRGRPGEKIGVFQEEKGVLGSVEHNQEYGIYGRIFQKISNPIYPRPIPVAWHSQIHPGPASMLTVINGEEIEEFSLNIEKIFDDQSGGKGIIVKVTDQRLLQMTGGIIQGMSGSPVIQEGRLVGAITHVFINDPARGYALSAEQMIEFIRKNVLTAGAIPLFLCFFIDMS